VQGKRKAVMVNSINNLVMESEVLDALRTCYDPEIPVNVYELGLVYEVTVDDAGAVAIKMTLTSPHCPAVQSLPAEIESKVKAIAGVADVKIDLVWDPPWDPSRMSEAARLQLGMM
jgi:FeS assembly SUF system protein